MRKCTLLTLLLLLLPTTGATDTCQPEGSFKCEHYKDFDDFSLKICEEGKWEILAEYDYGYDDDYSNAAEARRACLLEKKAQQELEELL